MNGDTVAAELFWTLAVGDRWHAACRKAHKITGAAPGSSDPSYVWYTADMNQSLCGEYEQCAADAKAGNERAQIYLATFIALRMTS